MEEVEGMKEEIGLTTHNQ